MHVRKKIKGRRGEDHRVAGGKGSAGLSVAGSRDTSSHLVGSCFPVQRILDLGTRCAGSKISSLSLRWGDIQRVEP